MDIIKVLISKKVKLWKLVRQVFFTHLPQQNLAFTRKRNPAISTLLEWLQNFYLGVRDIFHQTIIASTITQKLHYFHAAKFQLHLGCIFILGPPTLGGNIGPLRSRKLFLLVNPLVETHPCPRYSLCFS